MREFVAIGRRMTVARAVVEEERFLGGIFDDSEGFVGGSGSMVRDTGPALGALLLKRE